MRPYQARLCLRFAAVALGVGAVVVAAVGLVLPLEPGAAETGEAGPVGSSQATLPPLEQFQSLWTANLAAHTSTLGVQREVPQADASIPLRLAGTVGRTHALVATADGELQAVSVGDSIEGIEIVEIDAGQMTVRYNGKLVRIVTPPEPQPQALEWLEGGG